APGSAATPSKRSAASPPPPAPPSSAASARSATASPPAATSARASSKNSRSASAPPTPTSSSSTTTCPPPRSATWRRPPRSRCSTLDTRTRQWPIKDWGRVLLSDTVGFIRDLPHHLVASFKATLEETRQARLLLHVVDASNPTAEDQIAAVNRVLEEIGCAGKATLLVLNKVDRVKDRSFLDVLKKH